METRSNQFINTNNIFKSKSKYNNKRPNKNRRRD